MSDTENEIRINMADEELKLLRAIEDDYSQSDLFHKRVFYGSIGELRLKIIPRIYQLQEFLRANRPRKPIGQPVSPYDLNITKEEHMNIEFKDKDDPDKIVFGQVLPGQMFVSGDCLYHRDGDQDEQNSWQICDSQGNPTGEIEWFGLNETIERILPEIKRITF